MVDQPECPGCGSLLPAPDTSGLVTCPSCGRIDRVAASAEPPAESGWATPPVEAPPMSTWVPGPGSVFAGTPQPASGPTRPPGRIHPPSPSAGASSTGCGVAVLVAIVLVVVGAIGLVIFASADAHVPFTAKADASSRLYPSSGSAYVLPGEASNPGVVLVATDNSTSDSKRVLVRVNFRDGGADLVWKSAPLPDDVYDVALATAGETLFVGAGDRVDALSMATGTRRWSATITDKVTANCAECFRYLNGTLVVRSDDAYLAAFGPSSGEPRWTRRLQSPSAQVSTPGGRLAVVDDSPSAGQPTQVLTLEPASGKVLQTITPSCPANDEVPYDVDAAPGDRVLAVPGTDDLVATFGFGYGCVVRWEASTGKVRWATGTSEGNFDDDHDPLLTATDLVVTRSSAGATRVDLGTGTLTALEPIPDEQPIPRAIVGRTLLADTTTTRGTTRAGLAAWDLATGKRLWSNRLPGGSQPLSQDRYRSSEALFDGTRRTLLVTDGPTPRVLSFEGTDHTVAIQDLDPATGDLTRGTTRTFATRFSSGGTVSIAVEDADRSRLVLSVDSLIQVIPLTRDADIRRWPS